MFKKTVGTILFTALFLLASCGGGSSTTASAADTITLTVEGGTETLYSDSAQDVAITAYVGASSNMVVYLSVGTNLTMTMSFNNDPLTTATSSRPAQTTFIIGGITYQGTPTCTITALATGMGGAVQGSFPSTTFTSTSPVPSITVSGSFSATRIN